VVALGARGRRDAGAMVLGKRERRAHVLVAPVAEIRDGLHEHRVAEAAVAVVTVGARDPRERVLAAEEVVASGVRGVAAETRRGLSLRRLLVGEGAEPTDALPAAGLGVRAARAVARLAAPVGLGTVLSEDLRMDRLRKRSGLPLVTRDADVQTGVGGVRRWWSRVLVDVRRRAGARRDREQQ